MSLVDDIKNQVKKSGTNKGKFIYFRSGQKVRVRFLQDMEEGMKIAWHDSFQLGINTPCQKIFGRKCKHCNNEDLRHRDLYMWAVWDYEAKEVRFILGPVNNASPIPGLVGMYDAYGTLTDRDYVITRNGTGPNSTYSIVPMDKVKFKNSKAKPYSKSKALELLDKAFPDDNSTYEDDDDEDEDEKPKKKKAAKVKTKNEEIEDDFDEEEDDEEMDYEDMSVVKLYNLCKERDIECKPKRPKDYYIELLREYDEEHDDDDWKYDEEDEDEDDDWDEDDDE